MDNQLYGKMMLDNVSGMDSKMSLLSCYLYYIITLKDEEFIDVLKRLYHHEQKHLFIFLRLAKQLDVDPRLWSYHKDHNEYWSPSYNNYFQKKETISKDIILKKKKLIQKYQYQMKKIPSQMIQSHLKRIIKEEKYSISLLQTYVKS